MRQARFMGYGTVDHLWCVEVEGTDEGAHVRRKHQGYAALASSYDQPGRTFRLHVTLVFTFPPSAAKQQCPTCIDLDRQKIRERERAFAERITDAYTGW